MLTIVVKGEFAANTKWKDFTNVPLSNPDGVIDVSTNPGKLKVGGTDCIGVHLRNKNGNNPAHFAFTCLGTGDSVCKQVIESAPVKVYYDSKLPDGKNLGIAIGSTTSVYTKK